MKVAGFRLKNYKQFKDIYLDFTDKNGVPLNKICFIGRNGTGKSTILYLLNGIITGNFFALSDGFYYLKVYYNGKYQIVFSSIGGINILFKSDIENEKDWFEQLTKVPERIHEVLKKYSKYIIKRDEKKEIFKKFLIESNNKDLFIFSPAESIQNNYMQIGDVPQTSVNSALSLFNSFPSIHTVSDQSVQEFWRILIYLIKKRDNEREAFENEPNNLNKTKKELIEEFDKDNPQILNKLADLWDKILAPAGLEFDLENASNPIQLNDNLKAYIRLKSTKERVNYSQLSTGIRNFMFRLGHIYSLYFNREVKNGFLLLDEPENSLFPDFLIDLIDTYLKIIKDKNGENNTQFFVSTHNPIIAAQFEPYERIVLEWNEQGFVDSYKGEAPIGDDPNDLLTKDFKMSNLMSKKGQEMWKEYLSLRNTLIHSTNEKEKKELISKINQIGELYNFED